MRKYFGRVVCGSLPYVLLFVFSGCATNQIAPAPRPSYIEKVGTNPKIGESATAPVGGLIFSQFK